MSYTYAEFSPFASAWELEQIEHDMGRFHADPEAGRHRPECCCGICDPSSLYDVPDRPFITEEERREARREDARRTFEDPWGGDPYLHTEAFYTVGF